MLNSLKIEFVNESLNGNICNNCKGRAIETNTDIKAIIHLCFKHT